MITVTAIKARDQLVTAERTRATEAYDLSVTHVISLVHSCNFGKGMLVVKATVAGSGWADLASSVSLLVPSRSVSACFDYY